MCCSNCHNGQSRPVEKPSQKVKQGIWVPESSGTSVVNKSKEREGSGEQARERKREEAKEKGKARKSKKHGGTTMRKK